MNNAGFSIWGPTEKTTVEDFDAMFASNVRAPYLLVGAFAPAMAARGAGSIINISSMAGRIGLPNGAAYGATKAALASLAQSWAAEYSPRGVRVNAVAAGPIYTRPEARQLFDTLGATHRPAPGGGAERDRRGRRLPRLTASQLRHRRHRRRGWRPHGHLTPHDWRPSLAITRTSDPAWPSSYRFRPR